MARPTSSASTFGQFAETNEQIAPPRNATTVVSSSLAGFIGAIGPDGKVSYYNETHDIYYDVDPIGENTIIYSAVDEISVPYCTPQGRVGDSCTRQVVEKLNLSTGETTRLYERIFPKRRGAEWHDVDYMDESNLLIANMYDDRVYQINLTAGIITWGSEVQAYRNVSTGGSYPDDWVHLNDVEALEDGRIMMSLRNQDQVVFVNRTRGIQEDWTLGCDGCSEIIHSQHNPDYIPADNGGPAVLVADSGNDRIVEYQRTNGEWVRTWTWDDRRLRWPRDADRLPNGNTLIVDTHGDRIIEVNSDGSIAWSVEILGLYDVERLSTGDESNGPSAQSASLQSKTSGTNYQAKNDYSLITEFRKLIRDTFPDKFVKGLEYVLGDFGLWWVGFYDFLALLMIIGLTFGAVAYEIRLRYTVRSPLEARKT